METKNKPGKKKLIKRIIAAVVAVAIIAGVVVIVKKKGTGGSGSDDIMTGFVGRGSITSTVNGSGVTLAKNSENITILTSGIVQDVFVSQGDKVEAGDRLYVMDSAEAEKAYQKALRSYNAAKKELDEVYEATYDSNVRTEFAGMLLNVADIKPGDTISRGQTLATLVDNSVMKLHLYFSYAYENDIYVGQKASISVPSAMAQLEGEVSEIRMVKRIVPEGTSLFEVIFSVDNPGILTEGVVATATIDLGEETVYPYESGTLEYNRESSLKAKSSGEVSSSKLWNYAVVKAGESVLTLTPDSSEDGVASAESAFNAAEKTLEEAKKSLNSVDAKASISGTVLSVGVYAGETAEVGTVAISIADTTTMQIKASVDEMNASYVQPGMSVQINQWGNMAFGYVDSISLVGEYENGVSRFPMTIIVDNYEGTLMSGSYVDYSFNASQVDDCLTVPVQAVKYVETEEGTKKVVFIKTGSEPENMVAVTSDTSDIPSGFYPVEVEIGISDNYNAEVISGVEEGLEVFVSTIRSEMW